MSTSSFLSQAGRLQMTNAVLSSLPTFFMCTFKLHKTVIKQIDKYRKHCLWRGSDINARTRPKAAWELVCLPKSEGGLGVINLETHNTALLLKNLHKFFNKEDIPWVHLVWENYYRQGKLPNHTLKGSFWWRDNLKLLDQYKGIGTVIVNRGDTCYLWLDLWNNVLPRLDFPELFSFAKRTHITIQQAKTAQDISTLFNLPVSVEAYDQLLQLAQLLEVIHLSDQDDIWVYIWGSPYFSAAKAYKQLIGSRPIHPSFKWLWKSAVQHKHKVFFWLLLQDRLSTRDILHRKNMVLPSYACVLCPLDLEETLDHLFLRCPFAQSCWALFNLIIPAGNPFQVCTSFRDQLNIPFFMDVIIIMSWCIWMERNNLIFQGTQPQLHSVRHRFNSEFALVILRAKPAMKPNMSTWLQALVFRPRILIDVSHIDMTTNVLGFNISMPIMIAPTAMQKMAHPEGELATARAAASAGTIMTLSSWSTSSVEEVNSVGPGIRFFQLYVYKDRNIVRQLVKRAEMAGFKAIALTVDTPRLGRREADIKNRFTLPPHLVLKNFEALDLGTMDKTNDSGLASYVAGQVDRTLSWKDVKWLQTITSLPILVKGVMTAEDTRLAVEHGAAGIIVSNHGARQLDYVPATISCLEEVVREAKGRLPVFLDGGVRRGTDVFKALALGASGVFIGRPVLFSLAVDGEAGVRKVLQMLRDELELTMALSGCTSLREITRAHIITDGDRFGRSRL